MKIEMTFEGGAQLAKALHALPASVSLKAQREALRAGAEPMRAHAEALAPRGPDAPHIAEHIVIGIPGKGLADVTDEAAVVAVGPEKRFFYGFFWEYGTVKLSAHPFMRPAFDTQAPRSLQIIGTRLGEAIVRAAARLSGASRGRAGGVGL